MKINPRIGDSTLNDPLIMQAVANSPYLDILAEIPCIHFLFEFNWEAWGRFATVTLLAFYILFLVGATGMLIHGTDGNQNQASGILSVILSGAMIAI
jgi:hypothetical protein